VGQGGGDLVFGSGGRALVVGTGGDEEKGRGGGSERQKKGRFHGEAVGFPEIPPGTEKSSAPGGPVKLAQASSFVQAAFAFEEATTASMKAMPRMPSSIFG